MKRLKLPSEENLPSWGGLFGGVGALYIFVDPYQRGAGWAEWVLTAVAFAVFFVLFTIGLIYWSRRQIAQRVCIAIVLLALAFMIYRPTGAIFLLFASAFAPFAVGGSIALSIIALTALVLLLGVESQLLGRQWDSFHYIMAIESLLIGAAMIFVARQQKDMARAQTTAERERIARDLHDILGHTLSVIILKSELANKLFERDPKRAHAEIDDVERISRQALAEVREAIRGYHTGDIQTEFERAHAMLHAAGITVERDCEAIEIPAAQQRILVLALREAVTNVVRHSQANHCRLQFRQSEGTYRLDVCDDGRGGVTNQGMGIRGMRHRAESIGGNVSWTSGPGTELTVSLPITTSG